MTDVDMGTQEEAKIRFLAACDAWIKTRQPLMANAAAHKKRDALEHEARFQLANAALLLAWHMRQRCEHDRQSFD